MIYGHGDDLYAYPRVLQANFSSNVWHEGPSAQLIQALQNAVPLLGSYPDPNGDTIRLAMAQEHNLTHQHFTLTNGAVEAFYLIAQAWRQATATIFTPAFAEYEDAATLHNLTLTFIPEEQITDSLTLTTQLAFICNPNNPTGRSIAPATLVNIIRANSHTIFVVDEAYTDFTVAPLTLINHIAALPNLILVRGFTKTYAIPGVRIGYTVSQPGLSERIAKFKMPWSVNSLALEACRYILAHQDTITPAIQPLLAETAWLRAQIDGLGKFQTLPTDTPFFLIQLKAGTSQALKQYLAEQWQCLIRDASNFRGLNDTWVRIATQSREKNTILLNGLRAWLLHIS